MSDSIKATIDELVATVERQEAETVETKKLVNTLSARLGQEPMYVLDDQRAPLPGRGIRRDQFYGRPLATVVEELLEMRGPLTSEEIVAGLAEGDYPFEWKDELRGKNLSISLSKNMKFVRLPSGAWGLRSKYPSAPKAKKKSTIGQSLVQPVDSESETGSDDVDAGAEAPTGRKKR